MSKLAIEANLLALLKIANIQPIYEVEAAGDAEPNDNAEPGPVQVALSHYLGEVNEYIAKLSATERVRADLPAKGDVYFITDTTVREAKQRGLTSLADQLKHNQAMRDGIFNLADYPHIYTPTAGRYAVNEDGTFGLMVAPWPDHRVFPSGVSDDQVLDYVKQRVAENANANPDQKFPG